MYDNIRTTINTETIPVINEHMDDYKMSTYITPIQSDGYCEDRLRTDFDMKACNEIKRVLKEQYNIPFKLSCQEVFLKMYGG